MNEDGRMVLKRIECRRTRQLGPQLFNGVDPGDYLSQVGFVSAFVEQVFHHAPARFHSALKGTLDGGDETLRPVDCTADDQGVPGKVVAELMGHAKVDTTLNVYTQVLDSSRRAAVEKVGEELFRIVQKPETVSELTH